MYTKMGILYNPKVSKLIDMDSYHSCYGCNDYNVEVTHIVFRTYIELHL